MGFTHGDGVGQSQAALSGTTVGRLGHHARGQLHVGVWQDHHRVLGTLLGLHPLALFGCPPVDILGHRRGPHNAHRPNGRVVEDGVYRLLAAVHQLDDARRQVELVQQLEETLSGQGVFSLGLRIKQLPQAIA